MLDDAQAHRLRNVLRLGPGAPVAAFNAARANGCAGLAEIGKTAAPVWRSRRQLRAAEPEPDLWLLFAPIKRARLDWLIEKAIELGAAALVPVWTARTQTERLNRRAAAARWRLPRPSSASGCRYRRSRDPEPLDRVLAAWPAGRRLIVCDESGAGSPIAEALAGLPRTPRPRCLSARKAALPIRSLTLSANFPLLRGSGSARGCCAPRPPLLPPWRFFRRSPGTGAAAGCGDARRCHGLLGSYGNRMSGPSSVEGPPITDKRQLVEYHEAGNKPPADWRVGTEHEKFVFRRTDLSRVPYEGPDGIGALLQGMTRFGWKPVTGKGQHHRALERRAMFDHPRTRRAVRIERRARSKPSTRPATRCTSICARCARYATNWGSA